MENCPKCGLPVADGAKFCAACGTRMPQKLIKSKICSVCGNTLNAGAKFCNVCGTAVPQDETPADEPVVDERNPEMESIEVPELHFDDTPVQNQTIPPTTPDMPTMDSVYLPGQEPCKACSACTADSRGSCNGFKNCGNTSDANSCGNSERCPTASAA